MLRFRHLLTHILSLEQPRELSTVIFFILWVIKQNITMLAQLVNGKDYSLNLIISNQEDGTSIQGWQLCKAANDPSFYNT